MGKGRGVVVGPGVPAAPQSVYADAGPDATSKKGTVGERLVLCVSFGVFW